MVGARRARKFSEAGANVTVVAKEVRPEIKELNGVKVIEGNIEEDEIEELIKKSDIVVIATSSKEFNDKIFSIAKKYGKFINDATNAERSDVHVPFEDEVDGIRIAVSSEGRSGVSAHIALYIATKCLRRNELWKSINKFASEFKRLLKQRVTDPKKRFQLYWYVMLQKDVMNELLRGNVERALEKALEHVMKAGDIRGYEPDKAMPKFLDSWGAALLAACCEPYEDPKTRGSLIPPSEGTRREYGDSTTRS